MISWEIWRGIRCGLPVWGRIDVPSFEEEGNWDRGKTRGRYLSHHSLTGCPSPLATFQPARISIRAKAGWFVLLSNSCLLKTKWSYSLAVNRRCLGFWNGTANVWQTRQERNFEWGVQLELFTKFKNWIMYFGDSSKHAFKIHSTKIIATYSKIQI